MSGGPPDEQLPRLLSLSVHEFRTPLTVSSGYIRMLLGERAGPLTENQRKYLQEIEKACAKLSTLVAEMSDVSKLDDGKTSFNRGRVDLGALLADVVANLPPGDRDLTVELVNGQPAQVSGDASRLSAAFTSLFLALRRELVTSDRLLVKCTTRRLDGSDVSWTAVADAENLARMENAELSALAPFNDWRGGCGLSLQIARRVVDAHAGRMFSPADDTRTAAAVMLPLA
jgi:K+-sensing histidine kinase KdpD